MANSSTSNRQPTVVSVCHVATQALGKPKADSYAGEFFQGDGLEGSFEINLSEAIGMEVHNERVIHVDARDEVHNV